ncbi:kinesin-like protein costa [Lutzomyia longipalpis]|uniref:kinesin-like protein costa n=1 Tax=Lutzomyia longipalpis TaxID=7200 RepID=UPI00248361B6|nr:kinesin-like protein costa [Lutzomyia longipalpis]
MEIPIQVAVRVFPNNYSSQTSVVQISQINQPAVVEENGNFREMLTSGLVQVAGHTFPVAHALPLNCSQEDVFRRTMLPLIGILLEGYDTSVVSYGQVGTGKTYTLFGPGLDCVHSETEQGIVQRSIREIFTQLSALRDRSFMVNVGWVEICGEDIIKDLLDAGNVPCRSVGEAFEWLKRGLGHKSGRSSHSIFTVTLEQQWVSPEGLIQHRLSTASFCDLCGTDRMYVLNSMNQHLSIPKDLRLQTLEDIVTSLTDPSVVLYNNNVPYHRTNLTTLLKDSFGGRAQTLLLLTISAHEEHTNETIQNLQFAFKAQCVRNYVVMNTFSDNNTPFTVGGVQENLTDHVDTFGLQFAASQWFKLVSNAEGLLNKLVANSSLSQQEREQIEEWLFLKAECEECLSSGELNMNNQRLLGPIQETDEPEETSDQEEASYQHNTDSDSESHRPDLEEKIDNLMGDFKVKTDALVKECYQEFLRSHPKAVFDSADTFPDAMRNDSPLERHGRRKSIQPGHSLSSIEIAMLNRVASREQMVPKDDVQVDLPPRNTQRDILVKKVQKVETDLEATRRQMKELEQTISLTEELIEDLKKNNETRTMAKQRFNKEKTKLETKYEKAKKQLSKAVANGKDRTEIERLSARTGHLEKRLQDLVSIKQIAGESKQRVKKLEQSLKVSLKQLEALQKEVKNHRKTKETLEGELKEMDSKNPSEVTAIVHSDGQIEEKSNNLRAVTARISHLNHILQEKSETLEKFGTGVENNPLRHEIRNLRRTRDHLLEQRMSLDKKLKKDKILTYTEERKLLTYDEAIEAIDTTIELKNELICGRKSVDMTERMDREKGEQLLMARLNKLSEDEMRTLLYKYFLKVIDLRESSRKLEVQLVTLEKERDAWEWRERVLINAVRQARLEGEKHAVLLQRQHESKLTLMLRHLNETSTNSTLTDHFPSHYYDPDGHHLKNALPLKAKDMDLCPLPNDGQLSKYKPLDKLKEKERESKNKLLAKFQVLTRYHGKTSQESPIPTQNLKQLQSPTVPATKVTREKNKLIIQQDNARRQ